MPLTAYSRIDSYPVTDEMAGEFANHLNLLEGEYTLAGLKRYLVSALDFVERETLRIAYPGRYKVLYRMDGESVALLPLFPVTEINDVETETLTAVSATLEFSGGRFVIDFGRNVSGDITLTVTAGHTDNFPAPASYQAAVFAVAADLYEHRESQTERSLSENRNVKRLLQTLTVL